MELNNLMEDIQRIFKKQTHTNLILDNFLSSLRKNQDAIFSLRNEDCLKMIGKPTVLRKNYKLEI